MRKISDTDIQIMLGLWSGGQDARRIASLMNEQENTIKYYLSKEGVDVTSDPYKIEGKMYIEYLEEEQMKIRQRQLVCKHTAFRCFKCHLYIDNVLSSQSQEIKRLQAILANHNISF